MNQRKRTSSRIRWDVLREVNSYYGLGFVFVVASAGRPNASNPCSVVTMTASPTITGEAELDNSSPVGKELSCLPSFNPNTTATELERGVNSAVSWSIKGCAEIRPGNSFFQSIVPFRFNKYAKLSSDAASTVS